MRVQQVRVCVEFGERTAQPLVRLGERERVADAWLRAAGDGAFERGVVAELERQEHALLGQRLARADRSLGALGPAAAVPDVPAKPSRVKQAALGRLRERL